MKTAATITAVLCSLAVLGTPAFADTVWAAGTSQSRGFGHCAKGPCQRRATFEAPRPTRQVPSTCATRRDGACADVTRTR